MPFLLLHVVEGPVSEPLTQFLVQLVLILVLVRLLAKLLQRLRQPMVIGEIIAGVLLGPSAFGQIPEFTKAIFPAPSLPILGLIANVALIFFMFFLGLEVEVGLMSKAWKSAAPTAVVSIIIPFLCGAAIAPWVGSIDTPDSSSTAFILFLGTAFSFTAFPVLARILTTNRMLATALGIQSLSCAAIDDVLAWCTLALTLSYATGGSAMAGLYTALIAIGFVLFLIFVIRPILVWCHRKLMERGDELNKNFITALFLLLCAASWFAQIIGIHAFFGAFVAGIIVPRAGSLHISLAMRLELLIVEFLLPLYFAHSGLSTDVSRMDSGRIWAVCLVVCLLACVSKILPCAIMTHLLTGCFGFGYEAKSIRQLEKEQRMAAMERGEGAGQSAPLPNGQQGATGQLSPVPELVVDGNEALPVRNGQVPAKIPAGSTHAAPPVSPCRCAAPVSQISARSELNGVRDSAASPRAHASPRLWNNWFGLKRFPPASWRMCLSVGVLMNTRGLVALIVLNIGLEKGILSVKVFTIMVLMSLVTTLLTPPIIYELFVRGWDQQLKQQDEQTKCRQAEEAKEQADRQREYNDYLHYTAQLKQRHEAAETTSSSPLPRLVQVQIVPCVEVEHPYSSADLRSKLHGEWMGGTPAPLRHEVLGTCASPAVQTAGEAASRGLRTAPLQPEQADWPTRWPVFTRSPSPVSPGNTRDDTEHDDGWLSTASFFRHQLRSRSPTRLQRPRSRSRTRVPAAGEDAGAELTYEAYAQRIHDRSANAAVRLHELALPARNPLATLQQHPATSASASSLGDDGRPGTNSLSH